MDPILPLSPDGDATAQASPAVAMMRAAAEAKQRALKQQDLANQYKASEEARMNQQNDLAATREQHLQTQDQNAALQRTMAGDMAITSQDPAYKGKRFADVTAADPYYLPSLRDRYGVDALGVAQKTWDSNVPQVDRVLRAQATKHGYKFAPDATDDEIRTGLADQIQQEQQAKASQPPADIKSELVRLGKWRDGMTLEDAQNARDQGYLETGRIPEKYMKSATTLMGQIQHDPILAPFAKVKEAYDVMKSGINNPESGGYGDMALIEGFQRIVNPGASVRQQTMNNMLHSAGLGQYGDWDFLRNKIMQGDKLSPAARQRLIELADSTFQQAQRVASRQLAGKRNIARALGVPPEMTESLVNSALTYVANDEGEPAQGQQPGQPAGAKPQRVWQKGMPFDLGADGNYHPASQ